MTRFDVTVDRRDFAPRPTTGHLVIQPQRWDHHAIGGPLSARLMVTGPADELMSVLDWLRCPVTISGETGVPLWWGLVMGATVTIDGEEYGQSLYSMVNRHRVAFSNLDPGCGTQSGRDTTAWAQVDDSVAQYGVKEHLESIGDATSERADAARDSALAVLSQPINSWTFGESATAANRAVVDCLGWWKTLSWRYDSHYASERLDTADQIADIVHRCGQFLTTTDYSESGVTTYEYRGGDRTALEEAEALLKTGTNNNKRMLATVTPDRRVVVYEEPDPASKTTGYQRDQARRVSNRAGVLLPPGFCPAGAWMHLVGTLPVGAGSHLMRISPVFIERAEWQVGQDTPILEPRGDPSPWARPGYLEQG